MKSEKGITLTSLIIYVIAMVVVVSIIAVITKYFYSNISEVSKSSNTSTTFTKINSFISDEVNKTGNTLFYCSDAGDIIVFYNPNDKDELNSNSGYTQYTFKGDSIYLNKIKICKDVEDCKFIVIEDKEKYKFKIRLTIGKNEKEIVYTLKTSK